MKKSKSFIGCIPASIAYTLRCIKEKGYDAYLVGGCVRDTAISRPVRDWDVATSANPEEVARIFAKTVPTGVRYGTVTVILPDAAVEVTTLRADGEYSDGRRPDTIELITSLDEDLSRRDFTMNAMALSASGEIIDPFNGLEDIKKRVIRCVGAPDVRFKEDALRMFRAYRFSAEIGFTIEQSTLAAIYANADRANLISAERVRAEIEKTLVSQRPEVVAEMIEACLLNDKFGIRNSEFGIRSSSFERLARLPVEPALRWCAFCAVLFDNGIIQSCADFLHSLRLDAKTIKNCSAGAENSRILLQPANKCDSQNAELMSGSRKSTADAENPENSGNEVLRIRIKRLLARYGVDAARCAAAAADTLRAGSTLAYTDEIIASGECFSLKELSVTGHDLIAIGYKPGPELKKMLNELLEHAIEHPDDNVREALIDIVK